MCVVADLCEAVEEGADGAFEEVEEALGVGAVWVVGVLSAGAVEVGVLGVTAGADGVDTVGAEATGENGAGVTAGAGVADALGVIPLNVTFFTTL